MINHKEPPRWVTGRADCKLEMLFEALAQIVERDVGEFNQLEDSKRRGRTFDFSVTEDGVRPLFQVVSRQYSQDQKVIHFEMLDWCIQINGAGQVLHAKSKWNLTSLKCKLYVKDDPCEPWEISQRALMPLFFG